MPFTYLGERFTFIGIRWGNDEDATHLMYDEKDQVERMLETDDFGNDGGECHDIVLATSPNWDWSWDVPEEFPFEVEVISKEK